jgi:c-di-GMP-binding flagellar brake protein YcgR
MDIQKELDNPMERRKFMRFDIPLNVEFTQPEEASDYYSGITINFSRHGFCFESEGPPLQTLTNVKLRVQIPGKEIFVPITGHIVWTQNLNNRFMAGVQIRDMNREAKSDILEYCYNTWLETVRKRQLSSKVIDQ